MTQAPAQQALALMPDGRPVVSWREGVETHTRVWRPSGCDGVWEPLGSPVAGTTPGLVVPKTTGQPVLAVISVPPSLSVPPVVTVQRWNGTAWQAMGGPFTSSGIALSSATLRADAAGNVILAYVDAPNSGTTSRVRAARWNGSAWTSLSDADGIFGAFVVGGVPRALSMVMTSDGSPVLAWPTASFVSLVARFDAGTAWTMVGTPPATNSGSSGDNGPALAIDAAGQLSLASMSRTAASTYRVSVARFDGAVWQPLGGPLGTGTSDSDYALANDPNGAPVVVVTEAVPSEMHSVLFVYRWIGGAWVSSVSPTAGYPPAVGGSDPVLAVDGSGRLVAAWVRVDGRQQPGSWSIVVARTKL